MLFDNSYSIGYIIVLIADIWAIINVLQSGADNVKKLIWILLILVLPVLGVILWFFIGPRGGRSGI